MIHQIFRRAFVRRRMASSHLGIILEDFVLDLKARGTRRTASSPMARSQSIFLGGWADRVAARPD